MGTQHDLFCMYLRQENNINQQLAYVCHQCVNIPKVEYTFRKVLSMMLYLCLLKALIVRVVTWTFWRWWSCECYAFIWIGFFRLSNYIHLYTFQSEKSCNKLRHHPSVQVRTQTNIGLYIRASTSISLSICTILSDPSFSLSHYFILPIW